MDHSLNINMRIENNMGKKLHDIKDVTEKLGFKKSKNFFFTKDNMERMKKAATDKKNLQKNTHLINYSFPTCTMNH